MKTIKATVASPVSVYYCKAGLKTGRTIRVMQNGQVHETKAVHLDRVSGSMIHNNSTSKAKQSGARCVLIALSGIVQFQ